MSSEPIFRSFTLGDLGDFKNGANFSQDDYGPGYPIVNVKQLYSGRYVDLHGLESLGKDVLKRPELLFLEAGDILFARSSVKRAGAGQCALVPHGVTNIVFSGFIIRYRLADKNATNPMFLTYLLQSPMYREIFPRIATGTTISNLSQDALNQVQVMLPDKSTQDVIAEIFGTLDDRIALLRETNATLEAIAQALFKSWFVDFDPVRAKQQGREPEGMDEATAAQFPDDFEESELGLVPEGWRPSTLDGVSDVGIGKTPPRKEAHWFSERTEDVRWVSIRDMGNSGTFLSETSELLTKEAIDRFNVRRVPDGTVLLSFKLTIGRVAITDGEMTTNEAIAHCKLTDQSPLPSEFIYLHLKQFDYSTLSSTSSIADAVNSKTVKAIPILVPSADVVTAFEKIVGVLFERIKTVQQQAQTLVNLRDTLLPRLISGQLRLPEAEAMIEEVTA